MAEGKVVVTCGGWKLKNRRVEPWWAGIIIDVLADGTVIGAHPGGLTDATVETLNSGELFAVSLVDTHDAGECGRSVLAQCRQTYSVPGKERVVFAA